MAASSRRVRTSTNIEVVQTYQLTPHMQRIVFGAPGGGRLETTSEFTDAYVKLLYPAPGSGVSEPFDLQQVKETLPSEKWPVTRTYSIREFRDGHLVIDFVIHGDQGIAGPWAQRAQVGDRLQFFGPGGGYRPDQDAPWHLIVGDESALPAMGAALEAIPAGKRVIALVEVANEDEEQSLPHNVQWFYRPSSEYVGHQLVDAVRDLDFPEGTPQVFVHGEAAFVRELRRHLRGERGIGCEHLSISGYWRSGLDDEAWRQVKRDWNAQVEAEDPENHPST